MGTNVTTESVLSEEQIQQAVQCITAEQSIVDGSVVLSNVNVCFLALEQAVLQSPEVSDMNGAIRAAIFLLAGDATNTEYVRGMCELLAMLFPAPDMDTAERAEWFETKIHGAIDAAMKERP